MSLKNLLEWSGKEFSELPWRKNRSLYRTLVSEIMLQQTTVGTVKNHYERFLKQFPTIESLAKASEEELLVAWKGLGYYRRARNLKKIAAAIAEHGEFPDDLEHLQEIPGIGPYTANAIVAIGMDKRGLAIDANLERVISRLFGIKIDKGPRLQKEISKLFSDKKIFNEKVSFRALNEALMDLGRTFCQARKATCDLCPMKKECRSAGIKIAHSEKPKVVEHELHLLRVFVVKNGKLMVYKKDQSEWLAGQFEVPTFMLQTTDKKLKQYPELKTKVKSEVIYKTGITKYKIQNFVHKISEAEFKKLKFARETEWRSIADEASNFSTATIKGLKFV